MIELIRANNKSQMEEVNRVERIWHISLSPVWLIKPVYLTNMIRLSIGLELYPDLNIYQFMAGS